MAEDDSNFIVIFCLISLKVASDEARQLTARSCVLPDKMIGMLHKINKITSQKMSVS